MRSGFLTCAFVVFLALVTLVVLSSGAAADEDILPQWEFSVTMTLNKGEQVNWTWTAEEYDLDFNITDPEGDVPHEVFHRTSETGGLIVPITGDWVFTWFNNREPSQTIDYTVTLTYDIVVHNSDPTATIGADVTTGSAPLQVVFTGTGLDSDGTVVSYHWAFGDGTTSTEQSPTHTYSTPGTYTVTLTVTDDDGATGTATVEIAVINTPPSASIGTDVASGVAPLQVVFTGTGTDPDGTIASYHWAFGDGSTSTEQSPTHTFSEPGAYTVTLTVTDDGGATGTATVDITVEPVAPVIESVSLADGATDVGVDVVIVIVFSIPMDKADTESKTSITPSKGMGFQWADGDRQVSISFTDDLDYSTAYTLTIGTAKATNGATLAQARTVSFTTEELVVPTIQIIFPPQGKTFEKGEKVVITGTSTGIPEGSTVRVEFGGVSKTATVGADGTWSVEFEVAKKGKLTILAEYDSAMSSVTITVEEEGKGVSSLLWLTVIIILVIVIALIGFMLTRKKKPVEAPEASLSAKEYE